MTWDEFMTWLATDGQRLVLPGLGLAIVVLVFALWKSFKIGIDRVTLAVATTLVLGFSAEGFFEVLNESLALPAAMAGLFAIVGESLGIRFARLAHMHHHKHGVLGPNGRRVWYVAVIFGVIVAFNGQNWVECMLRLALPLLGALLWSSGYLADEPPGERRDGAVTWRWHPRRLAVVLGIIEPGARDLASVHRERLIRALTSTAHRFHHGRWLKQLRRRRMRRLALLADDAVVYEVAGRIQRVHLIEHLTAPATLQEYRSRLASHSVGTGGTAAVWLESAVEDSAPVTVVGGKRPAVDASTDVALAGQIEREHTAMDATAQSAAPAPSWMDAVPLATDPAWAQAASPAVPNGAAAASVPAQATGPAAPPVRPGAGPGTTSSAQSGSHTERLAVPSATDPEPDRRELGTDGGQPEREADVAEPDETRDGTQERPEEPAEKPFVAAMRRFWDEEVARGAVPSGADLSKAAGVDPSTGLGRRMRRRWEQELPAPRRATAPTGS